MGDLASAPEKQASVQARQEQRRLLENEIKLAETQFEIAKAQFEAGVASQSNLLEKERELLGLRRQLAALESGWSPEYSQVSIETEELARIQQILIRQGGISRVCYCRYIPREYTGRLRRSYHNPRESSPHHPIVWK